jgi:uncharacterized membrane protein YcfT
MNMDQRYHWVDYAKGICILAVVSLYANSSAVFYFQTSGLTQYWVDFAKPFRMPDFFLISGLFLARAIDKPWRHYFDRKVFHYLYFFGLWTFISWCLMIAKGELKESPVDSIKSLISMLVLWPHHQLWFILMLPLYFFATRLTKSIPVWVMFPVLCLLQMFPPYHFSIYTLNDFGERYVYFYAGYAFAPFFFSFAEKVKQAGLWVLLGILAWVTINSFLVFSGFAKHTPVLLVLGFAGALGVISLAVLLEKARIFNWVRYLGEHSIAIYLPFNWFMFAIAYLVASKFNGGLAGVYILVIMSGSILASIALYIVTKKITTLSFLFVRPNWIRLS